MPKEIDQYLLDRGHAAYTVYNDGSIVFIGGTGCQITNPPPDEDLTNRFTSSYAIGSKKFLDYSNYVLRSGFDNSGLDDHLTFCHHDVKEVPILQIVEDVLNDLEDDYVNKYSPEKPT